MTGVSKCRNKVAVTHAADSGGGGGDGGSAAAEEARRGQQRRQWWRDDGLWLVGCSVASPEQTSRIRHALTLWPSQVAAP